MQYKSFTTNGALRYKKGSIILTVYSNPFARFLIKNSIKKTNVSFKNNAFRLKPGNSHKLQIERIKEHHPLCTLPVTKILEDSTKTEIKNSKHQKTVKVNINGYISLTELNEYNNKTAFSEPKHTDLNIKPAERIKVGCHVSCSRNKTSFNYRLNIRHRILEEIAIKKERVNINRNTKGEFIMRKSQEGNHFRLYKNTKGHVLVYMQISPSLIRADEVVLFKKGRRCFSSRAYLSSKEFKLDVSEYFINKYERELAYALMAKNINVRIPEMRKREADIVLKDCNIQIEVTNLVPKQGENHKNSPHSEGIHINGRICEGFLRVTKRSTPHYFVVFNELWGKYKWVNDLVRIVKPKVSCIMTDFSFGWEKDVADKIKKELITRGISK